MALRFTEEEFADFQRKRGLNRCNAPLSSGLSTASTEAMIDKFAGIKEKYETNTRPARSVAVVFRDT